MSYADAAITTFANMLGTLDHLADKAQCEGLPDNMLASKLVDDMFPLEMQFRIALNQVLLALNQIGGKSIPLEETEYGSFAEVRTRIAAIRSHLDSADPDAWMDSRASVDLTLPNGVRFLMSAEEDIQNWIMPNFYFHVAMAYALLRKAGLNLGKMDFLRHMDRHLFSEI